MVCRGFAFAALLLTAFPCMALAKSPPASVDEEVTGDQGLERQKTIVWLEKLLPEVAPAAHVEIIPGRGNSIIIKGRADTEEDVSRIIKVARSQRGAFHGEIVNALVAGKEPPPVQVETDVLVLRVSRSRLRDDAKLGKMYEKWTRLNPPSGDRPGLWVVENPKDYLSFVQELRDAGLARIVAEPRLVCLSGQRATFSSGSDQPIPNCVDRDGNPKFLRSGTTLTVIPLLQQGHKIRLEIGLELSSLEPPVVGETTGVAVPRQITQRMNTTSEIEDGKTVGILMVEQDLRVEDSVSWLRDIPLLGSFLTDIAADFLDETEDVVVLVTPHLIDNP